MNIYDVKLALRGQTAFFLATFVALLIIAVTGLVWIAKGERRDTKRQRIRRWKGSREVWEVEGQIFVTFLRDTIPGGARGSRNEMLL